MSSHASSSRGTQAASGLAATGPGRHGLCPDCGRVFRLEGGEVPAEGLVLDCPACGAPMSLAAPPRRKRSYRILSRTGAGAEAPSPDAHPARPTPPPAADAPAPAGATAPPMVSSGSRESAEARPERQEPPQPAAVTTAPRRGGRLLPTAGLILGLAGGAGLLALLATRAGSLSQESLLALPIWARAVAASLPILGLGCGLLLRRRR